MAWYSIESDATGYMVASGSEYRVDALKRGSLFLKEPRACRVYSVFPHAINLEVSDSPLLYTLVNQDILSHPMAALVSKSSYGTFTNLGIKNGLAGYFDGSILALGSRLSFNFTSIRQSRSCDEQIPGFSLTPSELREQLAVAGKTLERIQKQRNTELRWDPDKGTAYYMLSGSGTVWTPFSEGAASLVQALYSEKPSEALKASLQLIGFGQGLTPSGDDFLCGFILALNMCLQSQWMVPYISKLTLETWLWGLSAELGFEPAASIYSTRQELTSSVSKTFLYLAIHNKFSNLLLHIGRSFTSDTASWLSLLTLLNSYGHSSGLDSATGFLYGMAAVEKRRN